MPLVSDAIVQVVAMMKNGTKVSIGYTLRTAHSDITVVIHEYDPTEVKKLQFLVLPVLADKVPLPTQILSGINFIHMQIDADKRTNCVDQGGKFLTSRLE